jgi:hypothetical protein
MEKLAAQFDLTKFMQKLVMNSLLDDGDTK